MNKKAQTFKMMNMAVFRLLFIIILAFAIRQFAVAKVQSTVEVSDLKANIIENRILYSAAINKFDPETGRVHPDIIELGKFKDEQSLEDVFNYSNNRVAVMLELRNLKTEESSTLYLNKKEYDRWEPLTSFKGYSKKLKWRYVLIDTDEGVVPGLLRIDVVMSGG
ncbi:hypothetical protein ACFLZ6_01290 [Nanoarchaeota archaeon]